MAIPAEPISGMKEASQVIQSYTYPLLQLDENRRPEMVASCVFLQVDHAVRLVTAAHALHGRAVGLMTRGSNHLFDIRAQGGTARGLNGEEFDIAILTMDKETVEKQAIQSISPMMLATAVDVRNPHARAFCGFPLSMNKQVDILDHKTKMVTTRCYTYFGFADFAGDHREFGKSPAIHLGLNYGPGTDHAGRALTTPPSPRGSSGGGTWLVPDFSKPSQVFLEGIVIECHQRKFVFATRIEHVVNFIRAQDSLGTRT